MIGENVGRGRSAVLTAAGTGRFEALAVGGNGSGGACRVDHGPRVVMAPVMAASMAACGQLAGKASLILPLSSSTRTAIFTNVRRIVSKVAPRQRERFGA